MRRTVLLFASSFLTSICSLFHYRCCIAKTCYNDRYSNLLSTHCKETLHHVVLCRWSPSFWNNISETKVKISALHIGSVMDDVDV
jgi:hypothetical protein